MTTGGEFLRRSLVKTGPSGVLQMIFSICLFAYLLSMCVAMHVFAAEYTLSDLYRIALERSYNVFAIVVEDDAMPLIRETMNMIRKEHPKIGLKTFVLQVEETI
ncbi:MAG: hypothetical protein NTX75_16310 [Proteobacteria bacterium]|nr:hypothetical protein [Pseudomonadota bacterium]